MKACGRIMKDRTESTIISITRGMGKRKEERVDRRRLHYSKKENKERERWREKKQAEEKGRYENRQTSTVTVANTK